MTLEGIKLLDLFMWQTWCRKVMKSASLWSSLQRGKLTAADTPHQQAVWRYCWFIATGMLPAKHVLYFLCDCACCHSLTIGCVGVVVTTRNLPRGLLLTLVTRVLLCHAFGMVQRKLRVTYFQCFKVGPLSSRQGASLGCEWFSANKRIDSRQEVILVSELCRG